MEFAVIPLILITGPVVVVFILMRYRYRQTQARYRALVELADKGVDLPAELLVESRVVYSERRRALVLIGGGLGLMAMFLALPGQLDDGHSVGSLWGLGLLPLMTGFGYLVSWWLTRRENVRG